MRKELFYNFSLDQQGGVAELIAAPPHDLEIVGSSLGSGIWKGCVIILAMFRIFEFTARLIRIRIRSWRRCLDLRCSES